jgi:UDP-2-acetamido-2,6-beta-L-arabino-hexul-4-ose reductase
MTDESRNVGDDELDTVFWINDFFDPEDPDTFFDAV